VNLEGDLYISKNIPYTIETLSIEFNRSIDQIKLALNVLMELQMLELTNENIYRIKNFAKHQNIKVKEKNESKPKNEDIKEEDVQVKENLKNETNYTEVKETDNKIRPNKVEYVRNGENSNLEVTNKDINKVEINMNNENINNNSQNTIPILLNTEKSKKKANNKKKNNNTLETTDDEPEDNPMFWFSDGNEARPLAEGERVVESWSF
jgi:hypothetical protein